jgi:hypothetical protein
VPQLQGAWRELPGRAQDIAIGASGSTWMVGKTPVRGGFAIYNWNGTSWVQVPGGGVRIAVDPDGQPWVVNSTGGIYQRIGNSWRQMPGSGQDIGIGANGTAWIIGTRRTLGGYSVASWNGGAWVETAGGGVRIAVGPDGSPYIVSDVGNIFQRIGESWQQLPGQAKDIAVGADGKVWIVGTRPAPGGFPIHAWNGVKFLDVEGAGTNIAVNPSGLPTITNAEDRIFVREAAAQPQQPPLQPRPPHPYPLPPT